MYRVPNDRINNVQSPEISGFGPVVAMCFGALLLTGLTESRIPQLFTSATATLRVSGIFLSLICIPLLQSRGRAFLIAFAIAIIGFGLMWINVFIENTHLVGDFRGFGDYLGLLVALPISLIMQRMGIAPTIRLIFAFCVLYLLAYLALSGAMATGRLHPEDNAATAYDTVRGYRLYSCASLIGFVAFHEFLRLRRVGFATRSLLLLALLVIVIFFQKSRVALVLYTGVLILETFDSTRLNLIVCYIFVVLYAIVAMVSIRDIDLFYDFFYALNDPTLAIRLASVDVAKELINRYPVFGLGFPTVEEFYFDFLGFLYFPEDLGLMGVLGSMGVVGLLFVGGLMTLMIKCAKTCFGQRDASIRAVGYATIYVLFTTTFSIGFYQGEASLVLALSVATFLNLSINTPRQA